MEVTNQQMEEFYSLREAAAKSLANKTLKDNPNVTYGQLLSPLELEFAAHVYSPEVKTKASTIFTPEEITQIESAVNWQERVSPYNKAPVDFDMYERFPEYQRRLDSYNEFQNDPINQVQQADTFNILDQREIDKRTEPLAPFGLEKSKEIARLGFDPSPDNQIQFKKSEDQGTFNRAVALSPRNMSISNYKFISDKLGLQGEFIYINPSKPSLGIAFKPEGEENYRVVDSPEVTVDDTAQFLGQEFPPIAGDIVATVYGGKKFGFGKTGPAGGLVTKTGKVLGLSGASAIGAAGGDLARLYAGKKLGYHDLNEIEMLKEAGVIGAWAFGGTAAITLSSRAILKLYKGVFSKDAPDAVFEAIDDALQASRQTDAATPGLLYGDDISVKQIQNQINELTDKYAAEFGQGYNPTMTTQAGTVAAADLEAVFLKNADDPKLTEIYQEIKKGNQTVIDEFVRVLSEKIGPSISGVGDATGATVSEGLRVLAQKDIDAFDEQAVEMINQIRRQVGGADDAVVAGEAVLKQVDNPQASSGPIFQRTQTRINEIRKSYLEPFNQAWNDALANPRYTNLKTGAGYTRAPAQRWLNARKGEAGQLIRRADGDEAVRELYNLIPAGSRNTIKRLTGKGEKGKFEKPNFTLNELNSARVALNDFASNLPDGKRGIARLARDLERGLEDQMNVLIREGASAESGIPMSDRAFNIKTLNKWIENNNYGDDLRQAWSAQKEALELSNSQAVRSILQQERPEKVAEYIFNTVAKGSKQNKPMTDLMDLLQREGSDEVIQIQEGLAAYIQREVLDAPDLPPLTIARNYRQFVKDNEGALRAVFGDEKFVSRFSNPKSFNKVIKGLEKTNEDILRIQARFGMVKAGDPDKRVTNIVESILATGKTQKQSGLVLDDIEYLASITKNNPELKNQVAQVTKRYLLQDIITPRQGGGFQIDAAGLDKLLKDGFGPEEVIGQRLTFDSFMTPLLGKKEGKEFIKNLKILNSMVQREVGTAPSERVAGALAKGEYGPGANVEGARMLMRLLIPPLTQTGRRATAITNRQAENSRKFIGRMLLDPVLFERSMRFAQGRESTQKFISFLTSYNMVVANDIGNEMMYYDTTDKLQKTPEKPDRVQNLTPPVPERLNRLIEMTTGAIN